MSGPNDMIEASAREAFAVIGSGILADALENQFEAEFASMEGKEDVARSRADRSIDLSKEVNLLAMELAAVSTRAQVERRAGDAARSVEFATQGYEALVAIGDVGVASTVAAYIAEDSFRLEDFDSARRFANIALETSASDDFVSQATGRCVLAALESRGGDYAAAMTLADEAIDLCSGVQSPEAVGLVYLSKAEVYASAGAVEEAALATATARQLFVAKGVSTRLRRGRWS